MANSIFTDPISKAENNMQEALYQMASMQSSCANANCKLREGYNNLMNPEVDAYAKDVKNANKLKPVITVLNTITVVIGVLSLFGAMIEIAPITAMMGILDGSLMMTNGGLQMFSGNYLAKAANIQGIMQGYSSKEQFLTDESNNIDTKIKGTYQTLSTVAKEFNQLCIILGQAETKVR